MRYEKVERDFIERTINIIKQYKECYHVPPLKEKYGTTLLLNCLIGLLIFPFETKKRKVKRSSDISLFKGDDLSIRDLNEDWAISEFNFEKINDFNGKQIDPKEASLRLVIYRMRNSIAHSRWNQDENETDDYLFYDAFDNKDEQGLGLEYNVREEAPYQSSINSLIFIDRNKNNDLMFKTSVTVKGLETFMIKFASSVLENKE